MRYQSLLATFLLIAVIGCGAPQPGLKGAPVNVNGKVSQAGQPVGNITVSFHPLDNGHLTNLEVKPDGTFQGELISGKYAYSIVQSTPSDATTSAPSIAPEYTQPDLQRTVNVEAGQALEIVLN
ncbi:MAG: hypothetical protein SH868_12490 [Bythopirellula sp.]|nr:hypothetical protein [Bythopirellula sp.]